ncbi:MAG: hypothetical protein H0U57_01515 [Tatlockia sp.]|nr:hypothetical protein [Tatlockia sp.]
MNYLDLLNWLHGLKVNNPENKKLLDKIEKTNKFLNNAKESQAYAHIISSLEKLISIDAHSMKINYPPNQTAGMLKEKLSNSSGKDDFLKSYKQNVKKVFDLSILCHEYKTHLENEALKEEDNYFEPGYLNQVLHLYPEEYEEIFDPSFRKIIKKHQIVSEFCGILDNKSNSPDEKLTSFREALKENRDTIADSRDNYGMIFLKALATVFSGGLAWAAGIWEVKGELVAEDLDEISKFNPGN